MLDRARDAGFVVLDLGGIYRGIDGTELRLAEWDAHPNVRGHQIIAAGLYEAIVQHADQLIVSREARK